MNTNDEQATYGATMKKELDTIREAIGRATGVARNGESLREAIAALDRLEAQLSAQQQPCPPHVIHEAIGGGWVCSACEAWFDVP